jgi:hypothetical protein
MVDTAHYYTPRDSTRNSEKSRNGKFQMSRFLKLSQRLGPFVSTAFAQSGDIHEWGSTAAIPRSIPQPRATLTLIDASGANQVIPIRSALQLHEVAS